jgi:hypothetical protein
VGNCLDFGRAAGRARDELLVRLLLKIFKTGKPAFEAVFLFAEEVVDDHKSSRVDNQ